MQRLWTALRALAYMAAFVLGWGWLALQFRPFGAALLPTPSRTFGVSLMIAGGALVLTCAAWFVAAGRGTPAPFDAPRSFVPGGPYRWVRNPIYLGGLATLAGFGFWHRSPSMVALTLPAFALFHGLVVGYEEPTLRRRFGAPYAEYLRRVNRWIPKPPRSGGASDGA